MQALTQKESVAKKKAAMSGDIAKALARLSSGLYVVTADSKGAKGAMVRRAHLELAHASPSLNQILSLDNLTCDLLFWSCICLQPALRPLHVRNLVCAPEDGTSLPSKAFNDTGA